MTIRYYWKDKENLAEVAAQHTKEMSKKFSEAISESVINTKTYDNETEIKRIEPKNSMSVSLFSGDSVKAIMEFAEGKTAVLNFASFKYPGGGFMAGSRAQEECLCHESFLYNVLSQHQEYYDYNENHINRSLYINRALYSPKVIFERDGQSKICDVITCAAPNITPSRKYGWGITAEENSKVLESRIKFVLDIAMDNNVDTLILGAFGCGVFGQDAAEVADLFIKYLKTTHKVFKKVCFAIPDSNFSSENYNKFLKALEDK